jgi:hypothetical protein
MDFVIIMLAFFFAILMCLGLILMKWIIAQLGGALFFMILFLMVAMFLLAKGDREYDEDYDE